jgi:hypothetical protein
MNGLESLKQGFSDMFNVSNNWFLGWPLCETSHGRLFLMRNAECGMRNDDTVWLSQLFCAIGPLSGFVQAFIFFSLN